MVRGRPGGRHRPIGLLPWPPAAIAARLASRIAWYSSVRGACCPRPGGLLGSNEPLPILSHCPLQSGYLDNSCAGAAPTPSGVPPASPTIRPRTPVSPLLLRVEIAQVRRRLILAHRHQQVVAAEEIVLLADGHVPVVLGADGFAPERMLLLAANV